MMKENKDKGGEGGIRKRERYSKNIYVKLLIPLEWRVGLSL